MVTGGARKGGDGGRGYQDGWWYEQRVPTIVTGTCGSYSLWNESMRWAKMTARKRGMVIGAQVDVDSQRLYRMGMVIFLRGSGI